MAQLNLIKTNKLDAVTTLAGKVGLFIDENGLVCKIDEAGTITEVGAALEYASNAEVLARTDATKVITPATLDGGVKRYKALLTQTGTDAPTVTILENTLGEIPTLGYSDIGDFSINTVNDVFTSGKTFISFSDNNNNGSGPTGNNNMFNYTVARKSTKLIQIQSAEVEVVGTPSVTASNGILTQFPLLIEVYP